MGAGSTLALLGLGRWGGAWHGCNVRHRRSPCACSASAAADTFSTGGVALCMNRGWLGLISAWWCGLGRAVLPVFVARWQGRPPDRCPVAVRCRCSLGALGSTLGAHGGCSAWAGAGVAGVRVAVDKVGVHKVQAAQRSERYEVTGSRSSAAPASAFGRHEY